MHTFFRYFSRNPIFLPHMSRWTLNFQLNLVLMRKIWKTIENISISTLFSINFHILSLHELVNTEFSPKIWFSCATFCKPSKNISICTLFSINFHEIQLLSLHELVNTEFSLKISFDAQNFENDRKHKHMQTFFNQFS